MTVGEQSDNPYEPPEHGGPAAVNGPLRQPINREKIFRAVLIWFGFLGFGTAINLLNIFAIDPEQPPALPVIILLVIGMINGIAFLIYNVLLLIWISRGRFRGP